MEHKYQLGPRSEAVYKEIWRKIDSGEYAPNTRLPTETELCLKFKASRSCIRKALNCLKADGTITSRQGSGSYVEQPSPDRQCANVISIMYHGDMNLLSRIQKRIFERGYVISFFSHDQGHWDPKAEKLFLRQIIKQRHKALLAFCTPTRPRNDKLLQEAENSGIKVIHIEHYRQSLPEQNFLMPDYYRAGYTAAVTLMLAGYEYLYFPDRDNTAPHCRLIGKGFNDALKEQQQVYGNRFKIYKGEKNNIDVLADSIKKQLKKSKRKTGILCASKQQAVNVYEKLIECGLAIPVDTGIIAVEAAGDKNIGNDLDRLVFNRLDYLLKAVELVTSPGFRSIRELIPPHYIKGNSINH